MNARFGLPATISVALAGGLRLWFEAAALEGSAAFSARVARFGALGGALVFGTSLVAAGLLVLHAAELLKKRSTSREAIVFAVLAFCASVFVVVGGLMFGLPLLRGESPSYVYEGSRVFCSTPFGLAFVVTGFTASIWTCANAVSSSFATKLPARAVALVLSGVLWCAGINVIAHFARGAAFFFERTGL